MRIVTPTFDTHKFHQTLVGSGFEEEQATSLIEGIQDIEWNNVATKEDIHRLERQISENAFATQGQTQQLKNLIAANAVETQKEFRHMDKTIGELQEKTGMQIGELQEKTGKQIGELNSAVADLKVLIAEKHTTTTRWLLGIVLTFVALIISLNLHQFFK